VAAIICAPEYNTESLEFGVCVGVSPRGILLGCTYEVDAGWMLPLRARKTSGAGVMDQDSLTTAVRVPGYSSMAILHNGPTASRLII